MRASKYVLGFWFGFHVLYAIAGCIFGFDWFVRMVSMITTIICLPVFVIAIIDDINAERLFRKHQREWDEIKASLGTEDKDALYNAYFDFLDELKGRYEDPARESICLPKF